MSEALYTVINLLRTLGIPLLIIALAMASGTMLERRHYRLIRKREKEYLRLPAVPTTATELNRPVAAARMVSGSVVVSLDYFKRFLAGLRQIFGGRIRSYESLVDRGRREAILRMKDQAGSADIIVNLRLVNSNIASIHDRRQKVGGVEVLAFGTVVTYSVPPPFGGPDT